MSIIETYETTTEICGQKYPLEVKYCHYPAIPGGSVNKPEPAYVEILPVSVKIGNALCEINTDRAWDDDMAEEILVNLHD